MNAKSRERIVMLIVVTLVFSITLIYFAGCLLDSEYYKKKAKEIEFSELYLGALKVKKELDDCLQQSRAKEGCKKRYNSKKMKNSVYLVTDDMNILSINFDSEIIVLLKYDQSKSKWNCFGWPAEAISQKECNLSAKPDNQL